ncbi:MAG: molybdopterin-containing oxidoreductase family protein [Conexivisphaera sp.]
MFAKVEGGEVVELRGDTVTGLPYHFCPPGKGRIIVGKQGIRHQSRLKHPLIREGERGEGKWRRISWDEALDLIAKKLLEVKERYGPEKLAIMLGEVKGTEFAFAQRFATAYGTPNVFTPANYCGVATGMGSYYTFGDTHILARAPVYYYRPKVLLLWGTNYIDSGGSFNKLRGQDVHYAVLNGAKVAVINPYNIVFDVEGMSPDPHEHELKNLRRASDADYWLKPRPGSDGMLALGMIKVIIEEGLYDQRFIDEWTVGFDRMRQEVAKFTMDDVERLTWVPKDTIAEVARLYARSKPGVIAWGNSLEQTVTSLQTTRAIAILRGITGNVNTPDGGETLYESAPIEKPGHFMLGGELKEILQKYPRSPERTIGGEFPLALRNAYVPTQLFTKSVLEGRPYQLKAAVIMLSNPVASYPNSAKVVEALKKLEFIVTIDIFPTPTTEISDIVLPAATYLLERDDIGYWPGWYGDVRVYPKLLDPPGEAWSDVRIINELAKRVGLEKYFFKDEYEAFDRMLKPAGLTFKEFKEHVSQIEARPLYDPFKVIGYTTPSGKIEIYSKALEDMGLPPMPTFDYFVERLKRYDVSEEYPFMLTNIKEDIYIMSGFKHLTKKVPRAFINPYAARAQGVEEGDWIYVETKVGRALFRAILDPNVQSRTVIVTWGYWGARNANLLTDDSGPYEEALGTPQLKALPCKFYKANDIAI